LSGTLFDDERSIARFPTKIGEYLAAARPVVTSSIGEVARYLEDATTAYLAAPGDAPAFGRKIVEFCPTLSTLPQWCSRAPVG